MEVLIDFPSLERRESALRLIAAAGYLNYFLLPCEKSRQSSAIIADVTSCMKKMFFFLLR